jgi:hypothetical protein
MPVGNGADAPIELTIGACAKIVRRHRDLIDSAMKDGSLTFTRDREGHRVTTWDSLIGWMRRDGVAK